MKIVRKIKKNYDLSTIYQLRNFVTSELWAKLPICHLFGALFKLFK